MAASRPSAFPKSSLSAWAWGCKDGDFSQHQQQQVAASLSSVPLPVPLLPPPPQAGPYGAMPHGFLQIWASGFPAVPKHFV